MDGTPKGRSDVDPFGDVVRETAMSETEAKTTEGVVMSDAGTG